MRNPSEPQPKKQIVQIVKRTVTRAAQKKRWGYLVYLTLYILLWVFLAVAILFYFWGKRFVWCGLSAVVSIKAVQQMVKTIGFGSIFLAWIYAILDKEELGFKYSELVQGMYSIYDIFVLGHLLAVLVCVWLAESNYLIGAVLALTIIFVGCAIHLKVLSHLVFRSKKRKRIAIDEWMRIITEEWIENKNRQLLDLFRIAEVVPSNDSDCSKQMEETFSYGLIVFSNRFKEQQNQRRTLLLEIARVWDHLLRNRPISDRMTVLDGVFRYCAEVSSECFVGPVCAGYILWFYNNSINGNIEPSKVLQSVCHEIIAVGSRLREERIQSVIHYMKSSFMIIVWLHFFCGTIPLSEELFLHLGEQDPNDYDLLLAVAQCVFQEDTCSQNFDAAFRQVFSF